MLLLRTFNVEKERVDIFFFALFHKLMQKPGTILAVVCLLWRCSKAAKRLQPIEIQSSLAIIKGSFSNALGISYILQVLMIDVDTKFPSRAAR